MQQVEIDGGVVVGMDNSSAASHALVAASDEAKLRGLTLHVVRAWALRTAPRPKDSPTGAVPSVDEYQKVVEEETRRAVAKKLGETPECPLEIHVVHAPSSHALLSASRGADLLVVGHRGREGFAGLMLGSVAEQCVRHASCPVLVVRPSL